MLRVAPTNQKLREAAFKYFLQSGHPEAASSRRRGLKLDPYNADLYDLKSNACLFLSDFKCAVDALEHVVSRADSHQGRLRSSSPRSTRLRAPVAEARHGRAAQVGAARRRRSIPTTPTLLG